MRIELIKSERKRQNRPIKSGGNRNELDNGVMDHEDGERKSTWRRGRGVRASGDGRRRESTDGDATSLSPFKAHRWRLQRKFQGSQLNPQSPQSSQSSPKLRVFLSLFQSQSDTLRTLRNRFVVFLPVTICLVWTLSLLNLPFSKLPFSINSILKFTFYFLPFFSSLHTLLNFFSNFGKKKPYSNRILYYYFRNGNIIYCE